MAYLTVEELKARYPRANAQTGVTSAQLASFIDEAGGEGDGYLAKAGFTVPVSPAPAVLVGKVAALAYGIFLQRNLHEAGKESGIAEMMKDAREWFEAVGTGQVVLVGSGGVVAGGFETAAVWANVDTFSPTFGAGDIEDAEVDPDRLEEERNSR